MDVLREAERALHPIDENVQCCSALPEVPTVSTEWGQLPLTIEKPVFLTCEFILPEMLLEFAPAF